MNTALAPALAAAIVKPFGILPDPNAGRGETRPYRLGPGRATAAPRGWLNRTP